ncbi:hypothetical protein FA04_14360 [Ensifer adhaerens]|nr:MULTISPECIES: hypothetical protein [Ensifer]KQX27069.1 hypothetical protein ASD01_22850 [Ensifer sp. Root423]KQZ58899.1 hypothetical protein ASD63_05380 [Ensifer sp. Root558]ANK73699.1 hypothetical protein FA04_14360 [Ensifer adhaerens]KDP70343.1 hypothetical protein FA04_29365 [Ensifer adhaerens]MBD9542120.1 hypothetical protein [Ensifer sp. ENS04]
MMSAGYRAYFVALAIVIATAVFVLIFTGEARTLDGSSDNFFRNVLYDFQTLITGVLALGAAWWTVHTMQIADVKVNRRHEQAMELGLRGDRLRIERALNPQGFELGAWHGKLPELQRRTETSDLAKVYWDIFHLQRGIADILSRTQFIAGAELFGGDLAHRVLDMQRWTENISGPVDNCYRFFNDPMPKSDKEEWEFSCWLDDHGIEAKLYDYVKYCRNLIPSLLEGLETVGAQYGVKVSHIRPSLDRL